MNDTIHFVTHQELWWFIGAGIGITSMIVGVIMGLLNRSHKSSILEEAEKVRAQHNKDLLEAKKEMNEIRENYIERFDEIKKINQDILITLEKIKTELEYIKRK